MDQYLILMMVLSALFFFYKWSEIPFRNNCTCTKEENIDYDDFNPLNLYYQKTRGKRQ